MRCVQGTEYSYIYNAWAGKGEPFLNESTAGLTFRAMKEAGETDEEIQKRVEFFLYRTPEEFYDIQQDPDCLHNLIDREEYQPLIESYRKKLYGYMLESQDGLVSVYKEKILGTLI